MKKRRLNHSLAHRVCGGGYLALASLSLVSVGFASYAIVSKDKVSSDVTLPGIKGDSDFVDINQYLTRQDQFVSDTVKSGVDCSLFNFSKAGFLSQDDEIGVTDSGRIRIPFSIVLTEDGDTIDNHLPSSSTYLKFDVGISGTNAASNSALMDFFGYFNITPSISSADNKPSSYDSYTGLASVNTATAKDNGFVFSFAIDKSIVGDKKSVYFLSVLTFKLKDSGQATNAYNARNNNALNLKASLFAEC